MRLYFVLLVLAFLALPLSAKNDAYVEDALSEWPGVDAPLSLPAPLEWKEIHGRLGDYGDVDAFSFHFDEAVEAWPVEVRVPVCGEHFVPVYPSVALIGVGLEIPEEASLPFTLADGLGAIVLQETERPNPRPQNEEFSFFYESPSGIHNTYYYAPEELVVDIPQAGDYTLAVWEPDGHVGAYFLWLGKQHPENIESYRDIGELEQAFQLIGTGSWMGQDCNAPLSTENCPAATEVSGAFPEHNFLERSSLGEGLVLTGTVYDAATCLPLAEAEIDYEIATMANQSDGTGNGTIYTNQQGAYRIESFYPELNVVDSAPQIRLYISAEGHESAMIEHILEANENELRFEISLGIESE
jgi:hypothetical protein